MAGAKSDASRMHGVLNCEGHTIPSYENEGGGLILVRRGGNAYAQEQGVL